MVGCNASKSRDMLFGMEAVLEAVKPVGLWTWVTMSYVTTCKAQRGSKKTRAANHSGTRCLSVLAGA